MADCNKPEIALNRENKTAIVTDTAVLLTNNLPRTEEEKMMKYENLALEIKNLCRLNSIQGVTEGTDQTSGGCSLC